MLYVVICPWKICNKSIFCEAQKFFINRISLHSKLEIVSPKSDFSSDIEQNHFLIREVKKHKNAGFAVLCCDENGKENSSVQFSKIIESKERLYPKGVVFCLGGAFGLPAELEPLIDKPLLSFSQMTFTHELASIVILEQIYRQILIRKGHPYHHDAVSALAVKL